ncbi:hypothetical protein, partial [Staphylococcus aureus]
MSHGATTLPEGAERYEGGMIPFAMLYAMEAAIDMVLEIGPAEAEERVLDLGSKTRALLREKGAEVADYASPIVAAKFPTRDAS